MRKPVLLFASVLCLAIFSCSKETSLETGNNPTQPGGGGGGGTGGGTGACVNSVVMKLTRLQSLFDANQYIRMSWNSSSAVDSVVMNLQLSEYLTAKYIYENSRIKEAVLLDHNNGYAILDTVVFRHNAAGKMDSMYRKGGGFDRSFKYDATGKLTRITRHDNGGVMYYYDITMDSRGNITKAVEFWNNGTAFEKQSTFLYSRDEKRNPFASIAPYMLELDDEYAIFRHWGSNNYVEQTYEDHTTPGLIMITGEKNLYNTNCYPTKSQNTIMGAVLFPNDYDWEYFYQ